MVLVSSMQSLCLLPKHKHKNNNFIRSRTRCQQDRHLYPAHAIRRNATKTSCKTLSRKREPFYAIIDSERVPDWTALPDCILVMILNKLKRVHDRVRFGVFCNWWHHVSQHNSHLPDRQLPMLMVPNRWRHTLSFFNPFPGSRRRSRTRMYDLDMHIPSNSRCIGSTEGWLIIEETKDHLVSVCLLNPFLSVQNQIHLPPYSHDISTPEILKLVLSAGPSTSDDYVVMAYFSCPSSLVFFRPGDEAWTMLDDRPRSYQEIIFYKNHFYTLDGFGIVKVWDFSTTRRPVVTQSLQGPNVYECMFKNKIYLVEALGDLLIIYRRIPKAPVIIKEAPTIGFKIYKLDPDMLVWNRVKSLGGHTLSLGSISYMSFPASQFPGYCKPNCIYFGYDALPCFTWKSSFDTVIFNLGDGSFERLVPPACMHSPIWIEPKVLTC